jgi:hypothetical protein
MSYARQLLDTYPGTLNADAGVLAATLNALSDCAQACAADADLAERNLAEMVTCIRLCLDCTDVCTATLGVVSRQTAYDPTITGRCWRRAWPPARAAATNAPGTLPTMSTAGSASRPAAVASKPAGSCWAC